jgi:hypothetical protein
MNQCAQRYSRARMNNNWKEPMVIQPIGEHICARVVRHSGTDSGDAQ